MCEEITLLDELKVKQTEVLSEVDIMSNDLIDFQRKIQNVVGEVLARTPLIITRSQRLPTNLDCDDVECYQLPPPIIPQVRKSILYTPFSYFLNEHSFNLKSIADLFEPHAGRGWHALERSTGRHTRIVTGRLHHALADL